MIPRQRNPLPVTPEAERPDLPPVQHTAVDYDMAFTNGAMLPLSIIDGDGLLQEQEDRYIFTQGGEHLTLFKANLAYVRRSDRTFVTGPELFRPSELS